MEMDPKMEPKPIKKSMKNSWSFWIEKISSFGWIWEVFWEDFGRIWEARGARMETKINEFRGHFATPSQEASRGGFGEGPGWIWEGFWEGFVRIWEDSLT